MLKVSFGYALLSVSQRINAVLTVTPEATLCASLTISKFCQKLSKVVNVFAHVCAMLWRPDYMQPGLSATVLRKVDAVLWVLWLMFGYPHPHGADRLGCFPINGKNALHFRSSSARKFAGCSEGFGKERRFFEGTSVSPAPPRPRSHG